MTPINETRANAADMALTMYAMKKEGHNHYDTRLSMFSDLMTDVCHAIRREDGDPDQIIKMVLSNFKAEEAQEKMGQEFVL